MYDQGVCSRLERITVPTVRNRVATQHLHTVLDRGERRREDPRPSLHQSVLHTLHDQVQGTTQYGVLGGKCECSLTVLRQGDKSVTPHLFLIV